MKFTVRFRGREITHPQKAREQLEWIEQQCKDIANLEGRPSMEGRTMTMMMSPKPAILQAVANAKVQAEKDRKEAEEARKAGKAVKSNPGGSKPGKSQPGKSEPGKSKPGKSKPGKAAAAESADGGDADAANGKKSSKGAAKDKGGKSKAKAKAKSKGKGKSADAAETETS